MIRYIFRDKTKNILAIAFTAGYILSGGPIYYMLEAIPFGGFFLLRHIATLVSYLLILLYLCTLTRRYPLKNWLFPLAFSIQICLNTYALITNFEVICSLQDFISVFCKTALSGLALLASIFCLIGSIRNFKQVQYLRIGILMLAIQSLLAVPLEWVIVGGSSYFSNDFFEYLNHLHFLKHLQRMVALMTFYFGIYFLTLNKKGPDIDITPYIAARQAKKAAKQAARLQAEAEREAPMPEIPDGYWRCMGCGEALPDEVDECACGYRKQ